MKEAYMDKTTELEKVITSVPVNWIADRVTKKGYNYTPINFKSLKSAKKEKMGWIFTPSSPQLQNNNINSELPIQYKSMIPIGVENMVGCKSGKMTAIGYYGKHDKKKYYQWVCRCVCGRYELRKTDSLRKGICNPDECQECNKLTQRIRHDKWIKEGNHNRANWKLIMNGKLNGGE